MKYQILGMLINSKMGRWMELLDTFNTYGNAKTYQIISIYYQLKDVTCVS